MTYRSQAAALAEKVRSLVETRRELDEAIAEASHELRAVFEPPTRPRPCRTSGVAWWAFKLTIACMIMVAGVGVVLSPPVLRGRAVQTAREAANRADASALRAAALAYRIEQRGSSCPSPSELYRDGYVDLPTLYDAWGERFVVTCFEEHMFVVSSGADGRFGTDDDVGP